MNHLRTAFSLSLILSVPLFAAVELNGNPQELSAYLSTIKETVMIEGKAEKKIAADRAIIHLKITTENRSMETALAENRSLREKITTQLLAAGLSTNNIQAAQFSSTPESGIFSDKVRSYEVKNTMKVTVASEAEFRAVAMIIDTHNEITYAKTEFELSTKKEVGNRLLAEACQDATTKKTIYEAGLNVTLTPIRFNNGATRVAQQQPKYAKAQATDGYTMRQLAIVSPAPPVQFDEMRFNANITVEYLLEAK